MRANQKRLLVLLFLATKVVSSLVLVAWTEAANENLKVNDNAIIVVS